MKIFSVMPGSDRNVLVVSSTRFLCDSARCQNSMFGLVATAKYINAPTNSLYVTSLSLSLRSFSVFVSFMLMFIGVEIQVGLESVIPNRLKFFRI